MKIHPQKNSLSFRPGCAFPCHRCLRSAKGFNNNVFYHWRSLNSTPLQSTQPSQTQFLDSRWSGMRKPNTIQSPKLSTRKCTRRVGKYMLRYTGVMVWEISGTSSRKFPARRNFKAAISSFLRTLFFFQMQLTTLIKFPKFPPSSCIIFQGGTGDLRAATAS